MKSSKVIRFLALAVAVTTLSCGEDEPSAFEKAVADLEGIYTVDSRTVNSAACTEGDESALTEDGDGYFFAKASSFFGIKLLSLTSCADPADCREKIEASSEFSFFTIDFSYTVHDVDSDGNLYGEGATTGSSGSETCENGKISHTTLVKSGSKITVTQKITKADPHPVDAEGYCTTDGAIAAAEGNSCSEMEVLTGTFQEAL